MKLPVANYNDIYQDTGKSSFESRRHLSAIDLNRAGTGLMEIVSSPDMRLVAQLDVCHGEF